MKNKEQKKARKEVKFKEPAEKKLTFKARIFKRLYSNEAEGLYLFVGYFPFFAGSWIAGGLVLDQLVPFVLATTVILVSTYGKRILFENQIVFKKEFSLILAASIIALLFLYYSYTAQLSICALLGLSALMYLLEISIHYSSPSRVILKAVSLLFRMSIYSIVGVLTQRYATHPKFVLEYIVFGFVPGSILAASIITRYSQVFLNHGWKRSQLVVNKGKEITRPASLSRLISLFIVVGPAIPLLLTPFDIFPTPFLAIAFGFTLIIKNLESYLKAEKPDAQLAIEQANIALLMSIVLLLIGLVIRLGVT